MPFDFKKLTDDITAALQAGSEAAASSDDKGACNFDGVLLSLPRLNEQKVVEALAQANVHTSKGRWGYFGTGYMINPTSDGQGNKRMVASEAIGKYLREAGYDALQFYMMD